MSDLEMLAEGMHFELAIAAVLWVGAFLALLVVARMATRVILRLISKL